MYSLHYFCNFPSERLSCNDWETRKIYLGSRKSNNLKKEDLKKKLKVKEIWKNLSKDGVWKGVRMLKLCIYICAVIIINKRRNEENSFSSFMRFSLYFELYITITIFYNFTRGIEQNTEYCYANRYLIIVASLQIYQIDFLGTPARYKIIVFTLDNFNHR